MRQHPSLKRPAFAAAALIQFVSLALPDTASAQVRYELLFPEVSGQAVAAQARGNAINKQGATVLNRIASFAIWQDGQSGTAVDARSEYSDQLVKLTASSINRYGQVIGYKTYRFDTEAGNATDTIPFYWDAENGLVDLDDLGNRSASGFGHTTLYGINDAGIAIGSSRVFAGDEEQGNEAFLWSFENGKRPLQALDEHEGISVTTPLDLNGSGSVVGTYRDFLSSSENYLERGFYADVEQGSRDLAEVDAGFFQGDSHTARGINEHGQIVGERGRFAYLYDTRSGLGSTLPSLVEGGATRAYAINSRGAVVGYGETCQNADAIRYVPSLWTESTGSVNLLDLLVTPLAELLPASIAEASCLIVPKGISDAGEISASLTASGATSYSREVLLLPVLEFHWSEIQLAQEGGIDGVLYRYDAARAASQTIPAAALGLQVDFLCSQDMKQWRPLETETNGTRLARHEGNIELFVPLSSCGFIKPVLSVLE